MLLRTGLHKLATAFDLTIQMKVAELYFRAMLFNVLHLMAAMFGSVEILKCTFSKMTAISNDTMLWQ